MTAGGDPAAPGRTVALRVPARGPGGWREFTLGGGAADPGVLDAIVAGGGEYEAATLRFMRRVLPADAVVLDVGANIGALSLGFAALCPAGAVHAFEPGAASSGHLRRNIAASGLANLRAHRLALSDRTGELEFACDPADAGAAHVAAGGAGSETVPATTLDAWVAAAAPARIDLIKIDVEGSEPAVLRGAAGTLARFRPALLVEVNPVTLQRFARTSLDDFFQALRACAPRLYYLCRGGVAAEVRTPDTLRALLRQRGICNLYAAHAPPGLRWLAGPARTLLAAEARLRDALRRRRGVQYVIEPSFALAAEPRALGAAPGARRSVTVVLRNTGREVLSSRPQRHPTHLSYRIFTPAGDVAVADGLRTPLPRDLAPGDCLRVPLGIEAPPAPGDYRVRATLVQEGWAWLDDLDPALGCDLALGVS